MSMTDTLVGLAIVVFAVVPGLLGEKLFRMLVGEDWRRAGEQGRRYVRVVATSAFGFAGYALLAATVGALPEPAYIDPGTFRTGWLNPTRLRPLAVSYLGHVLFAALVGLVAGYVVERSSRLATRSPYPDTWDRFFRNLAPKRWVLVSLQSGETFLGFIERADVGVPHSERDLVLAEPAQRQEDGTYLVPPYQYLFVPGELPAAVAVYANEEDVAKRATSPFTYLFKHSSPSDDAAHDEA